MLLWDLATFFDSIDLEVLLAEAEATDFPMRQLLLTLTVHMAPRVLKIGNAFGEIIEAIGRSILAGCKRSTTLARALSIRMVHSLAKRHSAIDIY